VASRGEGLDEVVEALEKHRGWLEETGELQARRVRRAADEVEAIALTALRARIDDLRSSRSPGSPDSPDSLDQLAVEVAEGRTDPYTAADQLVAGLTSG